MGGENFLVDTVESSEGTVKEEEGVSMLLECGTESDLSLGGLEEPLNILFSNPPWFEPRCLFPASLKVGKGVMGKEKGRGGSEGDDNSLHEARKAEGKDGVIIRKRSRGGWWLRRSWW